MPGVLQRLPGDLEQEPLLRVERHAPRAARCRRSPGRKIRAARGSRRGGRTSCRERPDRRRSRRRRPSGRRGPRGCRRALRAAAARTRPGPAPPGNRQPRPTMAIGSSVRDVAFDAAAAVTCQQLLGQVTRPAPRPWDDRRRRWRCRATPPRSACKRLRSSTAIRESMPRSKRLRCRSGNLSGGVVRGPAPDLAVHVFDEESRAVPSAAPLAAVPPEAVRWFSRCRGACSRTTGRLRNGGGTLPCSRQAGTSRPASTATWAKLRSDQSLERRQAGRRDRSTPARVRRPVQQTARAAGRPRSTHPS